MAVNRDKNPGFTLVEVLLSTIIAGFVLVASLHAVAGTVRMRRITHDRTTADALADELLAEILAASFVDEADADTFGPETNQGESPSVRLAWDDLDDYAGWSASPPQRKDGTQLDVFADWSRGVLVGYVDPATLDPSPSPTQLIAVVVNVVGPSDVQATRHSLRSPHSAAGQPPIFTGDVVRHVDLTMQIGVDGPAITSGTNLWSPAAADD